MAVYEFLVQWKDQTASAVWEGNRYLCSYAELYRRSMAQRELLGEHRLGAANVALLTANTLDSVLAYWSLLGAGATILLLDAKLASAEVADLVKHADCSWIIGTELALEAYTDVGTAPGLLSVEALDLQLRRPPGQPRERRNPPDIALMVPTSGSTGPSKIVMLSHANLAANTAAHIQSLGLHASDVALIVLPLGYSYAHTSQFLCHTRLGSTVVLYDKPVFFPRVFCELIETQQVTVTALVPTLLYILERYPYLHEHDLSSLRYLCCGGAPLDLAVAQSLAARLPHTRLIHTYGLTEAAPRVTTLAPDHDLRKLPSIGKPLPGVAVQIVDKAGLPLPPGAVGELCVRGANVMVGYYNDAAATATVLHDGWLHTGDLASCDADGYIYLMGRAKHIIITGGVNVSPEEIERVLLTHPAIMDAVVKGEERPGLGEVPVAYLVLKPGYELALQALHDFLRGKLAEWKWPRKLYIREALAHTSTGKVKRHHVN